MEDVKRAMQVISKHALKTSKELNRAQVENFIDTILNSKRVFIMGAGRSGLVAKAFAMRLMHIGFNTYVVGETVTPSLKRGDVFIAVSGSGETSSVVNAAKIAKKVGAKIVAITSFPKSSLGKTSHLVVEIPGRTKTESLTDFLHREIVGEYASLTPLGTLFEVGALIFLDGVVASLMRKLGKKEEELRERHATIE